MGRYLILDHEEKARLLLKESLRLIDSQAQFEEFNTLLELDTHIAALTQQQKLANFLFDLLVLDYSFLNPDQWPDKLEQLKTLNSGKPTSAILFCGYENSTTQLKIIKKHNFYNFIFKPFDPLILKESLNLALKIGKKAQPLEMKSQTATAFVALLKEVELQSVSELGFVTISENQLEKNSVTKFFSSLFSHGKKQSTWAQCLMSIAHPQKPGFFINKFQFIEADQSFLNTIRRYIQNHKSNQTSSALWNFNKPTDKKSLKLALISSSEEEAQSMQIDLQQKFINLTVDIVKLDASKKTADQKLDYQNIINMTDIKIEKIKDFFKDNSEINAFLISDLAAKEDDLKELSKTYKDLFLKPLDRSYFFKKLKIHIPLLEENESTVILNITSHEKMKATQKVKISEISELYVNFTYSRELPYKEFREFVFLGEDENQVIELPAFCHFTEKASSGDPKEGGYLHQFTFFAMSDHYLKQIRLWLLHNYILQNQEK